MRAPTDAVPREGHGVLTAVIGTPVVEGHLRSISETTKGRATATVAISGLAAKRRTGEAVHNRCSCITLAAVREGLIEVGSGRGLTEV